MPLIPRSGRESIWEYPRKPVLRPAACHIQIFHRRTIIADTQRALKLRENGHAPTYYIPPSDVRMELLEPSVHRTFCEWKGVASYFHLVVGGDSVLDAAWTYEEPVEEYGDLANYLGFYPAHLDACLVEGEPARPEPRRYYGGWITSELEGPFR